ncbi:MAG: right-handed parallel beta-helix repeat-containing protein [Bacteroidetes Order II. Incertae sedis bacterium]|nr:right-handed parallel beta-helix repeat-containing protein [Bacteroidetes Order II. bacterium]
MRKLVLFYILYLLPRSLFAQAEIEKQIQTQLIMVEDGGTVQLPEGTFNIRGALSMDGKKHVTIKGAGKDKTVLNFKSQTEGAEGLRVTDGQDIVLEDFSVVDAKGDAIKVQKVDGITFRNIKTAWTAKGSEKNGAYGLYPVQCTRVLIEGSEAIGASDAGIYVGQSDRVVVRKSRAYQNVAGIEIENTTNAEVYDNEATGNTGGVLVFDLPGLPKKQGGNVKVYDNHIHKNNYRNFAPKGNMVATVPAGTGVIILATSGVEVTGNRIEGHKTVSVAIASYLMTEIPIQDQTYNPFPSNIFVHQNTYQQVRALPDIKNRMGQLLLLKFRRKTPHVVYDGILNPALVGADGRYKPEHRICVEEKNIRFTNLDAGNKFKALAINPVYMNCRQTPLKIVAQ